MVFMINFQAHICASSPSMCWSRLVKNRASRMYDSEQTPPPPAVTRLHLFILPQISPTRLSPELTGLLSMV